MESRADLAHHAGFDAVLTILGAVHVDIRTHRGDERHRHGLVEDVHVIDVTERQQDVGALRLRHDRPLRALVRAHARVAVQSDNQDVALSTKGVDPNTLKGTNLGACGFNGGLSTPDNGKPVVKGFSGIKSVLKWGVKLASVEADCNVNDTGDTTEWPLAGSLSITFTQLNNVGKNEALSAAVTVDGFTDPDNNPGTPSDVVAFHGLVTKGVAVGADIIGETEFDPTVKDKTQTTATPYFGYQYDLAQAGGCADATPNNANITAFNNGSVANQSQLLGLPVAGISFTIGS